MRKVLYVLVLLLVSLSFWGCGSTPDESEAVYRQLPNVKMKVVDVSNETEELFDVDVIGLLWTALDRSLKRRDMLWTGEAAYAPYAIEAKIMKYQKGSVWYRWLLPMWGKTLLTVECDVVKGGLIFTTVEAQKEITFGEGTFTRAAWRKVFGEVAEDLVKQIAASV